MLIFRVYNSKISYKSHIGKGTRFGYGGIGVVIHERAVIGKNCGISTNVTIGGRSGYKEVPIINVRVSTRSKVLDPIKIGNNVVIEANAVVIKDVSDNSVVAGVPAKIIKFAPIY